MNEKKPTNPWAKSLLIWVGILFGLVVFVQMIGGGSKAATGEAMNRVAVAIVSLLSGGNDRALGKIVRKVAARVATVLDFSTTRLSVTHWPSELRRWMLTE